MKTKIFSILLTVAAMVGFSACSDDWNPDAEGSGQLRTASLGVEVDGAETIVSDNSGAKKSIKAVSSRATIDLSNFIVAVSTSAGKEVERWTYSTMPELPTFAAGEYTVTVKSHEVEPAAWNAPYYEGTQTFTIVANQITEVETVVCKLANIRVSVAFTDDLLAAFDNANEVSVKVSIDNAGTNSLTFTPSETRSGYFQALSDLQTLRIDFSASILGNVETFTKTIDNVEKGQHRKITFGLTSNPNLPPDELGTIINDGQGITIDNTVDEDDPIETNFDWYEDNTNSNGRPGDEDFDDGDKPGQGGEEGGETSEETITFTSETLNLEGPNNVDEFGTDEGKKDAIVTINSANGFKNLTVNIVSDYLTEDMMTSVGLATEFDLANPGSFEVGLKGLGFKTGTEITADGVTEVPFDITQFMAFITKSGDHKFIITVVDKTGHSNSMTLILRKN
jgi:hypothetical protein